MLLVLIIVTLMVRCTLPIYRGCAPTGLHPCQPFVHFRNPMDTGLLWMYALYSPPIPKKLSRVEMLLRTRSLIVILLIIKSVESNPGEFLYFANI